MGRQRTYFRSERRVLERAISQYPYDECQRDPRCLGKEVRDILLDLGRHDQIVVVYEAEDGYWSKEHPELVYTFCRCVVMQVELEVLEC